MNNESIQPQINFFGNPDYKFKSRGKIDGLFLYFNQ